MGVTPICAASEVPAASATGRGKNRSLPARGAASATIPAVAPTESWKPMDHTSAGSTTSRINTAPASIEAALRGRPSKTPNNVSPAITPARITDGSPAGEYDEEQHGAAREEEPGDTRQPQRQSQGEHGPEDHGHVLS